MRPGDPRAMRPTPLDSPRRMTQNPTPWPYRAREAIARSAARHVERRALEQLPAELAAHCHPQRLS